MTEYFRPASSPGLVELFMLADEMPEAAWLPVARQASELLSLETAAWGLKRTGQIQDRLRGATGQASFNAEELVEGAGAAVAKRLGAERAATIFEDGKPDADAVRIVEDGHRAFRSGYAPELEGYPFFRGSSDRKLSTAAPGALVDLENPGVQRSFGPAQSDEEPNAPLKNGRARAAEGVLSSPSYEVVTDRSLAARMFNSLLAGTVESILGGRIAQRLGLVSTSAANTTTPQKPTPTHATYTIKTQSTQSLFLQFYPQHYRSLQAIGWTDKNGEALAGISDGTWKFHCSKPWVIDDSPVWSLNAAISAKRIQTQDF